MYILQNFLVFFGFLEVCLGGGAVCLGILSVFLYKSELAIAKKVLLWYNGKVKKA